MPSNRERPLAPHVRAAIAQTAQPKTTRAGTKPRLAPHVLAAITAGHGVGAQPKLSSATGDERQVAPHVQRAVAGVMHLKKAVQPAIAGSRAYDEISGPFSSALQPMKRTSSEPELNIGVDKGTGEECFGVSQGHYAIKEDKQPIGTDSLGSCFAVIAHSGAKVFLAHVAAGNTPESIIEAMGDLAGGTVIVVRGTSDSIPTTEILKALQTKLNIEKMYSKSQGAVVFYPESETISCPSLIAPSNSKEYKLNNFRGQLQKPGTAIQPM